MARFDMTHCSDEFHLFDEGRLRVAITSFPGSGNTWARHLLHMATGYWTGNAKSSEKLKRAGWKAEDIPCIEGKTIAIKTHKWVSNKLRFKATIVYECIRRAPFSLFLSPK